MTKKLALFVILSMLLIMLIACSNKDDSNYFIVEIVADNENVASTVIADYTADNVYAYLALILSDVKDYNETEATIINNLNNIGYIVSESLKDKQIDCGEELTVTTVSRDARQCGNIVIAKGSYRTLIITLGEGNGGTNFCMAYPSLTYVEGEKEIILKSRLYEIVKEKKANEQKN